jgi:hypothetical protein
LDRSPGSVWCSYSRDLGRAEHQYGGDAAPRHGGVRLLRAVGVAAPGHTAPASSIVALTLGALGQVAYHPMSASGVETAPWPITAAVACLPVAVLGMGATLAHLLTVDDEPGATDRQPSKNTPADLREASPSVSPQFRPAMSAPPGGPSVAPAAPFARVGATPDQGLQPVRRGVPGRAAPAISAQRTYRAVVPNWGTFARRVAVSPTVTTGQDVP